MNAEPHPRFRQVFIGLSLLKAHDSGAEYGSPHRVSPNLISFIHLSDLDEWTD
jgi:hypothetical protein